MAAKVTGSQPTPVQKAVFLCKTELYHYNLWLIDTASNGTSSRLNQTFQKRMEQTEIDKRTQQWRPEGDERATIGIRDCPCVLHAQR